MQSFLNSPPGPLGAAGQASNSTQPPNIFSNAPQALSGRVGEGIKNFAEKFRLGDRLSEREADVQQMFDTLFGGEGNMLSALEQNKQGEGFNPFQPQAPFQAQNLFGPGNGQTVANNPALGGQNPMIAPGPGGSPFAAAAGQGGPGVGGPQFNPNTAGGPGGPGAGGAPAAGILSRFMQGGGQG